MYWYNLWRLHIISLISLIFICLRSGLSWIGVGLLQQLEGSEFLVLEQNGEQEGEQLHAGADVGLVELDWMLSTSFGPALDRHAMPWGAWCWPGAGCHSPGRPVAAGKLIMLASCSLTQRPCPECWSSSVSASWLWVHLPYLNSHCPQPQCWLCRPRTHSAFCISH